MIESIIASANQMIEKYDTRNPFKLAEFIGIHVKLMPLGTLKGFYKSLNKERYIALNDRLEKPEVNIVLAHEIGHDQLHRHYAAISTMYDNNLLLPLGKTEKEANLYAAEILLSDDRIMEYVMGPSITVEQLGMNLGIPIAFLQYKLHIMNHKNPVFKNCISELISDFLKF